ncbi:hypothetical protein BST61_g9724 [Cercospora zeina]
MDLAGPTLERTLQIIPIPTKSSSPSTTVLKFRESLRSKQETEVPDIHAPWNLIRSGLAQNSPLLHEISSISMKRWSIIRQKRTVRRRGCINCWIEGKGKEMRSWTQILADEEVVGKDEARDWAQEVMGWAEWLQNEGNWGRGLGRYGNECSF